MRAQIRGVIRVRLTRQYQDQRMMKERDRDRSVVEEKDSEGAAGLRETRDECRER